MIRKFRVIIVLSPIKENSRQKVILFRFLEVYLLKGGPQLLNTLNEWYDLEDKEKFDPNRKIESTDNRGRIKKILEDFKNWSIDNNINRTPSFFINRRDVSEYYSISDIAQLEEECFL